MPTCFVHIIALLDKFNSYNFFVLVYRKLVNVVVDIFQKPYCFNSFVIIEITGMKSQVNIFYATCFYYGINDSVWFEIVSVSV
ncbi:hypothetical protein AI2623V1_5872 (plasmid) [Klebsiella oxytoca]|nr:hypothetical protein AI2623V1_5872 [Klebsiella oxytoca]CAH5467365.1 hypothetical protein AI2623V1_5872 [Klebsiella oxytoca]